MNDILGNGETREVFQDSVAALYRGYQDVTESILETLVIGRGIPLGDLELRTYLGGIVGRFRDREVWGPEGRLARVWVEREGLSLRVRGELEPE